MIRIKHKQGVKLLCGHKFHYDCIFLTYKCNTNQYGSYNKKRECPYFK